MQCTFVPANELPIGWRGSISRPDAYAVRAHRTRAGGSGGLSARSTGVTADDFLILKQAIRADDFRGRRVRLTGTIRSRDVGGCAALWLRVDTADRSGVAFDNMRDRPIVGTCDWGEHGIVLDVAPDAVQIALGLRMEGPGEIWVDRLAFEIVGPEVDVTDMRLPAEDWPTMVAPTVPTAPVNLGLAW